MEAEVINLREKRLEQVVVGISAKIADALEMSRKAKTLSANSEERLIQAQLELEELFVQLNQMTSN
jgi:hypothetical protein